MLKRSLKMMIKSSLSRVKSIPLKNISILKEYNFSNIFRFSEKPVENDTKVEENKENNLDSKKIQFEKGNKILKNFLILSVFGVLILSSFLIDLYDSRFLIFTKKLSYIEFVKKMEKNEIEEILMITDFFTHRFLNEVVIKSKDGSLYVLNVINMNNFLKAIEFLEKKDNKNKEDYVKVKYKFNPLNQNIRFKSVFAGIYVIITYFLLFKEKKIMKTMMSQGNMSSVTRKIQTFLVDKIDINFDSIAGLDTPKLEIKEFVDFLKDPARFHKLGARMPRGVLLTGPPGTGKTMLAKACAKEADISFFSISGSDFVEKYVGIGAANVRKLFEEARKNAPSIIFIDEIDAIGKKRENRFGNDEKKHTLNQLLVEMDGFGTEENVVIMAATNKEDALDKALTRPGRFDRHINLELPDLETRQKIFKIYLKKLELKDKSKNGIEKISRKFSVLTPGFSGAEIRNLCNEAAILAAREEKEFITEKNLEEATERIIGGLRQKSLLTENERKTVSIHECGHAVLSWNLKNADPLLKISLVARSKGKLGFSQYFKEDINLLTKSEIIDRITFLLGGRAAEEVIFGENYISNGAEDDFKDIFELAQNLVAKYGMGDELKFLGQGDNKLFGEKLEWEIDEGIMNLVDECYKKAIYIIEQNKDILIELSDVLLEKERIDHFDIQEILGDRKFEVKESFKNYLEGKF